VAGLLTEPLDRCLGSGSGQRPSPLPAGDQLPLPVHGLYFVVIGWWFSLLWAGLGWLLCTSIIGLPLGVVMSNSLPVVTTLQIG
jgi:hypothetical protein